jgi:hypothetical protein
VCVPCMSRRQLAGAPPPLPPATHAPCSLLMGALLRELLGLLARRHAPRSLETCALLAALLAALLGPFLGDYLVLSHPLHRAPY